MIKMWQIWVPRTFNNGEAVPLEHHKRWDDKVSAIAGGLTILKPAKGIWVGADGRAFEEEMIPVKIACTKENVERIADATLEHYRQEAIIVEKTSDEVIIKHRK